MEQGAAMKWALMLALVMCGCVKLRDTRVIFVDNERFLCDPDWTHCKKDDTQWQMKISPARK